MICDTETMFEPRGHRPGGDPVQKHSAGDLYPYVIEVVENNGVRRYVVTGPGGVRSYADTDREATEVARWLKRSFDRGHPVLHGRPVQTLGEYLARKYDIPYPDSDGGEA